MGNMFLMQMSPHRTLLWVQNEALDPRQSSVPPILGQDLSLPVSSFVGSQVLNFSGPHPQVPLDSSEI